MVNGIIVLATIWIYPFLSFFALKYTETRISLRSKIFRGTFIVSIVAIFGLLTNISFTLTPLNWIFCSTIYLSLCHILNITQFQPNKIIKIFGSILSFCIYGIGFIMGSVGILGIGFILGDSNVEKEVWLSDGLIYKQFNIGNAISDNRGTRIEIHKTIPFFPLIEWEKQEKMYWGLTTYENPMIIKYDERRKKIYLSKFIKSKDGSTTSWRDSLNID